MVYTSLLLYAALIMGLFLINPVVGFIVFAITSIVIYWYIMKAMR